MKTINEIIKEARKGKRLSIEEVEKGTKIKKGYLEAIEKGHWNKLPEYPVLAGFIKNIAEFLGIEQNKASALFRRDYPPQTIPLNPKPDVGKRFIWSPRFTFVAGISLV